ncbi:hypothetical protein Tco_0699109 [Tanacetum coccineum]
MIIRFVPFDTRDWILFERFWHTVTVDSSTQTYFFMLDDQRFEVGADLLRNALHITPKVPDQPFVEPPPHDDLVSFIKKLGYPRSFDLISKMHINHIFNPSSLGNGNKCNVDYADLIWDDFRFQIDSRQSNAKKKELLPFPRFTKFIIKHILSQHNTVSKRSQSDKHAIKLDTVLRNLKFVNKGVEHPRYGMAIPEWMMSDKIKAFADYLNYMAKSTSTQSSKGLGKGLTIRKETGKSKELTDSVSLEETKENDEERHLNERHSSVFISREVNKETYEETLDHPAMKLKGVANVPKTETYNSDDVGNEKIAKDQELVQEKVMEKNMQIPTYSPSHSLSYAEYKVEAMSKIDHKKAIDKSVQAHLKNVLPKAVPDFGKIKQEKAAKKNMPKYSIKPFDEDSLKEYDQKNKLMSLMMKSKSFKTHPAHQKLHHNDEDPPKYDDKDTKKRRKNTDASLLMKDKDQAESSKEAKAPSEPSKTDKAIDAEESIQDDVIDAEESIQDDDDAPTQGPLSHKTIPVDLFFNKDLEYLKTGNKEKKYAISLTKLKAVRYELEGLEEMIPKLWSSIYSRIKILSVIRISVDKQFSYGFLKEIVVKRADQKEYMFNEADFLGLHLNDIEDMYLLKLQNKLHYLTGDEQFDLVNALHLFIRRTILKKRVEDVQLSVESYQMKLNLTMPQTQCDGLKFKEPYTIVYKPRGVVYQNKSNQKILMRADEMYKFSDGTLKLVHDNLDLMLHNFVLGYNNQGMPNQA